MLESMRLAAVILGKRAPIDEHLRDRLEKQRIDDEPVLVRTRAPLGAPAGSRYTAWTRNGPIASPSFNWPRSAGPAARQSEAEKRRQSGAPALAALTDRLIHVRDGIVGVLDAHGQADQPVRHGGAHLTILVRRPPRG